MSQPCQTSGMTHDELDKIEANLRKVDKVTPNSYGIVTALELAAELRKLLPTPALEGQEDAVQSQSVAVAVPV